MKFNKIIVIFLLFSGFIAHAQQDSLFTPKPLSQYPPELLKTDEFGNKYYYDEAQKAKYTKSMGKM